MTQGGILLYNGKQTTMALYKCKTHDRFPAMVERENWKGILNALGERFGNAHGVGNDAVITQTRNYYAVIIEANFHSTEIKYDDHKESGQRQLATNNYRSISDIPDDEIIRYRQIILGGTLLTHTCSRCMGWGKVKCPMCSGRGHSMQNGLVKQCVKCHGRGEVSCSECSGTGEYQTFKTMTLSDRTDTYSYCPVQALDVMIRKQDIPTDVLYDGTCLKMNSAKEIRHNEIETLYSKISERLGAEEKNAFQNEFEQKYNDIKERANSNLDDITVCAKCSPMIEIDYKYRNKEYSLFISNKDKKVYCYARFPGRLPQRIRELFSSGKKEYSQPQGSKGDRKLERSYGSKYQK